MDQEIAREQTHVDTAYARLAAMRAAAEQANRRFVQAGSQGSTHEAIFVRDALAHTTAARAASLTIGDEEPLVFGRFLTDDGEDFHIGRVSVHSEDLDPLVVDWRAPISAAFYQATPVEPMGLTMRRHLRCRGPKVLSIEDELLSAGELTGDVQLVGEAALMATLSAPRTGFMHDIVATIQREQDQIIRAPMRDVVVVQGGPGTGKTAVALHRAAYLLYAQREWLDERRVLVVGPTRRFLRYVERVLPSLGETVVLRTVDQLVPGVRIGTTDAADAARIKGDPRMVGVLTRAAGLARHEGSRRRPKATPVRILRRLWSDAEFLARAAQNDLTGDEQRVLRRSGGATAWTLADACLLDELTWNVYGAIVAPTPPPSTRDDGPTADFDADQIVEELVASSHDLSDTQRAVLADRIRGQHEAAMGDDDARPEDLYGHVVVDEAQELSPVQWRVIGRRCPTGSMTVVGDLGQASAALAARSWDEVIARIPGVKAVDVRELTINYRTPSEIAEIASAVLAEAAPDLTPPRSIRSTGDHPQRTEVPAGGDLDQAVLDAATAERRAIEDGTVAVVCPDDLADRLTVALVDLLVDERMQILPIGEAHGLEYDAVVVVEPARIVAASPRGLGALYVALTRATRRLHVVHAEPLPSSLERSL